MSKAILAGLLATAFGSGAALVGFPTPALPQASPDAAKCAAVSAASFGAASASGKWVEADAAKAMPAYCEVAATLAPVPGSQIGVVYRLPENWNGKLLGLGGGGWAGNVTLMAATPGLKAGYATLQTNGGHPSTSPWDTDWTSNPEAVTDFQYRAINRMTVAGKALVRGYYGKPQDRAYFHGCSTGGRMALMEAQRFPEDYDAIISEAPVYSLQVQTSAVLRNKTFAQGGGFTADQLKAVNQSVLKVCDAKDGVEDGVIADPRRCAWQPSALAGTLSPKQVTALDTLYKGIRMKDGRWAMFPLSRGGELGWSMFIKTNGTGTEQASGGGLPGLVPLLFKDRQPDFATFDPDRDVGEARASAFAKAYEATSPDLSKFFARGGKLLMWHGESDPGPSPVGTIDYVSGVRKAVPSKAGAKLRLFLAPGVGHCRGGAGADIVDNVATLDQWVSTGKAPETVIAHRADGKMTRPLCAWPKVARFTGKGDANDPKNYACEAPKG